MFGSTNNTNQSPIPNFATPGDSPPVQKPWGQIHKIPNSESQAITVSGGGVNCNFRSYRKEILNKK